MKTSCLISSETTDKWRGRDSRMQPGFLITPSDEAFAVWCVKNYYTYWMGPSLKRIAKAQGPAQHKAKLEEMEAEEKVSCRLLRDSSFLELDTDVLLAV